MAARSNACALFRSLLSATAAATFCSPTACRSLARWPSRCRTSVDLIASARRMKPQLLQATSCARRHAITLGSCNTHWRTQRTARDLGRPLNRISEHRRLADRCAGRQSSCPAAKSMPLQARRSADSHLLTTYQAPSTSALDATGTFTSDLPARRDARGRARFYAASHSPMCWRACPLPGLSDIPLRLWPLADYTIHYFPSSQVPEAPSVTFDQRVARSGQPAARPWVHRS